MSFVAFTPAPAALAAARPSPPAGQAHAGNSLASDLLLSGSADADGYRVQMAAAMPPWRWSTIATLAPPAAEDGSWVGRQCLTGDGRYAVAVVAPSLAASHPDLVAHGGFAYAIDIASRRVTALASGVTLAYFAPACGVGDDVALTSYASEDDAPTSIAVFDASVGTETAAFVVPGEVTSAVPRSASSVIAVEGARLVGITSAGTTTLASLPGDGFDLHPNAAAGVDLLASSQRGEHPVSTLLRWTPSVGLVALGSGPLQRTRLFGGLAGTTAVVGADSVRHVSPEVEQLQASAAGSVEGVSSGLDALLLMRRGSAGLIVQTGEGVTHSLAAASGPAGGATVAAPSISMLASSHKSVTDAAANTTTPTCAVPRLDLHHQIVQPSSAQVDWAVELATRDALTRSRTGDPSWNFTSSYTPSRDFPISTTVPREVMSGIMVAESNWEQASFHAIAGVAGDPLVANYYGVASNGLSRDYANADCGYGLTQQTDGMRIGDSNFSAQTQQEIGLDYAENAAAGTWTLVGKWNQLKSMGIIANGGSPAYLENWYFAIWAYNTGVHAQSGSSPYGLGWANNPINPIYPANRDPYLQDGYGDASHPSDWPYQEQVFGWMAYPLLSDGSPEYAAANNYPALPAHDAFCSISENSCNPSDASSPCTRSDLECWWHAPASWVDCSSDCTTSYWPLATSAAEPATPRNPFSPPCNITGPPAPSTHAIVVDDEADGNPKDLHVSLNSGCSGARNWTNAGKFTLAYGSMGMVDFHQYGAGFDGHMYFSHEVAANDAADTVTGTWAPTLPSAGTYMIWAFVAANGATAIDAPYVVHDGAGHTSTTAPLRQDWASNAWLQVGMYHLSPGATVSLSNNTSASINDLGFDALAFEPAGQPVLLIHGSPGSSGTLGGDDGNSWGTLQSFLDARGFSAYSEGYYYNDANMDDYIDYSGDAVNCYGSAYYKGGSGDGEQVASDGSGRPSHNNQADYRHLAYQLAWRIHDLYGSQNVLIEADSAGGVIVRWMLYQLDAPSSSCPYPKLYISNVVTTATPHDGANNANLGCSAFFEDCEIETYTSPDQNPFLSTLNGSSTGRDPQATSGTVWTLIGSLADTVVPVASALSMGSPSTPAGTMFWMGYYHVPSCSTASSGPCSSYSHAGGSDISYHHGGYVQDADTSLDASWYYGSGQTSQTGQPHAVEAIWYALANVSGFSAPAHAATVASPHRRSYV